MHYYQFNIGDYLKQTTHLTSDEDLTYRRLLDLYYDTEGPIPTAIPLVSRKVRMPETIVQTVLDEFFVLTEGGYRNKRADAEILSYRDFLEKQRSNGKLGGRPKKTHRYPTANPPLTQRVTQTKPKKTLTTNHKPVNNNIESRKIASQYPADFAPNDTCVSLAESHGVPLDIELPKFRDFHQAKGSVFKDWQAAFRMWINNAVKFNGYVKRVEASSSKDCVICGSVGTKSIGRTWYCANHDQYS